MQSKINSPVAGQTAASQSPNQRAELLGRSATESATSPEGGSLFREEFERANSQRGIGEAETKRADRRTDSSQAGDRGERGRAADEARTDAREARRRADDARSERRDDGAAAAPVDVNRRQVSEKIMRRDGERRMEASNSDRRRSQASLIDTADGKSIGPDADSSGPVEGIAGLFAGPAPAAQGVQAGPAGSGSARAVEALAGPRSNASPKQASASPLPGPQTTTEAKAAGDRPVEGSTQDAVDELLLRREQQIEREASVLRQLRAQLAPGKRELSMQLHPAELGHLHLRMALRSGRLTAVLRAESPEALAALERQLPEVSASLEAQGFEVVEFDLELMDPDQRPQTDSQAGSAGPPPSATAALSSLIEAPTARDTSSNAAADRVDPDAALDLFV